MKRKGASPPFLLFDEVWGGTERVVPNGIKFSPEQ